MLNEEFPSKYPSWIDRHLFERALKQDHPTRDIHIQNYSLVAAIPAGENFTSQLIRAVVTYKFNEPTLHETKFIIKTALGDATAKDGFESMKLFEREVTVFQAVLPEVYKYLQNLDEADTPIAPKCYEASMEKSYLIMEDLTVKGYATMDQTKGLPMEHFRLMFSKLARWHAATSFLEPLMNQYPDLFGTHQMQSHYIMKNEIIMQMEIFARLTDTMPGFERISEKLTNSTEKFHKKVVRSFQRDANGFTAFCHGDLWSNNVMFKHNENGEPIDAIFVDFQFSYYGPAVIDVGNTLHTSSKDWFRENHWDELVQHYHSELLEVLQKLNYSKHLPTLTDIQAELLRRGISTTAFGLYEFAARGYVDIRGEMNVTDLMADDLSAAVDCRMRMVEKAKNNDGFKFMLNYFDRRGYFDFND